MWKKTNYLIFDVDICLFVWFIDLPLRGSARYRYPGMYAILRTIVNFKLLSYEIAFNVGINSHAKQTLCNATCNKLSRYTHIAVDKESRGWGLLGQTIDIYVGKERTKPTDWDTRVMLSESRFQRHILPGNYVYPALSQTAGSLLGILQNYILKKRLKNRSH